MANMQSQQQHVPQLNRQQEMHKIGSFQLEEGITNYMDCTGIAKKSQAGFSLSDLQEMNSNLDQIMRANNVPRGGHQHQQ